MAKWDEIKSTGNVEDRRGNSGVVGLGAVGTIVVVGIMLFTGSGDPQQIQSVLSQLQSSQSSSSGEFVDTEKYKEFTQKIIGSNNDVWRTELAKQNIAYKEPKLVLFRGVTDSACGGADSRVGPHYCPTDQTIYLDETFFEELTSRFGAKGGDVAEAYVMAHEVGHHVQKVRGKFGKFDTRNNETSVKVELQADCYAGVWAGNLSSEGIISPSEIDQALDAAAAVGDDRIQKSSGAKVNPETWTHGSSADRKKLFTVGYETKDATRCSTIN